MSNPIQSLKNGIARIQHPNGAVVGAGFLVTDRHLLTCAHVVTAALALPQTTQEKPDDAVGLSFPLRMDDQKQTANIIAWHPVNPGESSEDIAVLELSRPHLFEPVPVVSISDYWNHPLRIFGFPKGHDDGVWATGTLRDQRGNGWIQLDTLVAQDRAIEPGFSGAPIWDEQADGVVGMAVAAEKQRQGVSAAYMIPASILETAWSGFTAQQPRSYGNLDLPAFKLVKLDALKKYELVVIQKYEAAWNQLSYTLSESDKVTIREQVRQIEQELQQLDDQIQALSR